MRALLLNSILIATVVIPLVAARDRLPRRGLRHAIVWSIAYEAFYLVACIYLYPRLPN